MLIEGTNPLQSVSTTLPDDVPLTDAVRQFKAAHPQARLEAINGEPVRGICEDCGAPVMEKDKGYGYDPENGIYICPPCAAVQGDN